MSENKITKNLKRCVALEDPLYDKVKGFCEERGATSIATLQREFAIGYNRAYILYKALNCQGVISGANKTLCHYSEEYCQSTESAD